MTRARPQPLMKSLAAGLGVTSIVLLLLAFDEGQASRAVDAVRSGVSPVIDRASALIKGQPGPAAPSPAAGAYPVIYGRYVPRDEAPTGPIDFVAAEMRMETGGTLKTTPLRIAYGREGFATPLKAAPDAQIELRRITPMKGTDVVPPSPLCAGAVPGWVALAPLEGRLEVMLFRAGPPPDATDPARALCGRWTYVKR